MPSSRSRRSQSASTLERWHLWCGLVVLVFLLLAAVSGIILVYKKPLIHLVMVPHAELPATYNLVQMAAQLDLIATHIAPAQRDLIKAPNPEEPYWTLTGIDKQQIQLLSIDTLEPYQHNLWLLDIFAFMRILHTELFTGVIGEGILLISGVAGLFLCISGIILWWRTKRSFRWRWVFPRHISARYLMHYHRHSGALASIILVVLLLTGSIMLWQKLVSPLLSPAPSTLLPNHLEQVMPSSSADAAPSQFLLAAHEFIPDGWPTYIRLPAVNAPDASIRFRLPNEWHPNGRTSVKINSVNGDITLSARSDEVSPARRLVNQLYPLHSAYGMNAVYVFLVFLGGITLIWLSLTGGISYFKKRSTR
jgi:uncharacterized iron-regulated membrane protein